MLTDLIADAVDILLGQDATRPHHPDAVVRVEEVEEGGGCGWRFEIHRPRREHPRISILEGVQHQRRQREVVDHLRLVRAIAEVGDVVGVGNVGFGDHRDVRRHRVEHVPEELDHLVGLRKVGAGGTDLLPQIGDGVQPHEIGAVAHVEEQDLDHLQQHPRVLEVEVDLILGERGPHPARAVDGLVFGQHRRGPRPQDQLQVLLGNGGLRRKDGEEILVLRVAGKELLEPVALGRYVVEDAVEHQLEVILELGHVLPGAELRVHLLEGDDRESTIRRIRVEGQYVD